MMKSNVALIMLIAFLNLNIYQSQADLAQQEADRQYACAVRTQQVWEKGCE